MFKYITDRKSEGGFTLVELMVVILIIAILLAVAIPVFLNARNRAVVRAAQQRLGSAIKAAKSLHSGGGAAGAITEGASGLDYTDDATFAGLVTDEAGAVTVVDAARTGEQVEITGITGATQSTRGIEFTTNDANGTAHVGTVSGTGAVTIN